VSTRLLDVALLNIALYLLRSLTALVLSQPAEKYIQQFRSTAGVIVAQFVSYVSGAFVAVLLLLAVGGYEVLINLSVLDRALIWYE